jgi:hypothetical protein
MVYTACVILGQWDYNFLRVFSIPTSGGVCCSTVLLLSLFCIAFLLDEMGEYLCRLFPMCHLLPCGAPAVPWLCLTCGCRCGWLLRCILPATFARAGGTYFCLPHRVLLLRYPLLFTLLPAALYLPAVPSCSSLPYPGLVWDRYKERDAATYCAHTVYATCGRHACQNTILPTTTVYFCLLLYIFCAYL